MNARSLLSATVVSFGLLAAAQPAAVLAQAKDDQIKTVYHLTNGLEEASRGLGNIRNHLAADPKGKITVVTNGKRHRVPPRRRQGQERQPVRGHRAGPQVQGRRFPRVQQHAGHPQDRPVEGHPGSVDRPSGVAEAAKLQAREGYVYLRP